MDDIMFGSVIVYDNFNRGGPNPNEYEQGNAAEERYDLFPKFNPPEGCYSIEIAAFPSDRNEKIHTPQVS